MQPGETSMSAIDRLTSGKLRRFAKDIDIDHSSVERQVDHTRSQSGIDTKYIVSCYYATYTGPCSEKQTRGSLLTSGTANINDSDDDANPEVAVCHFKSDAYVYSWLTEAQFEK